MSLETFRKTRAGQKRAAALTAASALFRQEGYERVSMEAVANAAGISTATLYRQFPSKEALFEAVATGALDSLAPAPAQKGDAAAQMKSLAVAYAAFLAQPETRGLMRMLIAETGRNPRLAALFYERVKSRLGEGFAAVYVDGVEAGVFKRTKDVGHAAGQLQGMIEHAVLMRGLILGDEVKTLKPTNEIARSAVDTWLAAWRR